VWQLSEQKQINVCSQLDWKRSLAIHLWYLLPPTASISRALSMYEEAFQVYVSVEPSKIPVGYSVFATEVLQRKSHQITFYNTAIFY
jgi:hypothetical protein